jgi:hypothetical protein
VVFGLDQTKGHNFIGPLVTDGHHAGCFGPPYFQPAHDWVLALLFYDVFFSFLVAMRAGSNHNFNLMFF